jgi:hypothetical protein
MSIIGGYQQGWWSVAGLSVEICGFLILATDVAREYNRHRTIEKFRAGAAAAARLVADDFRPARREHPYDGPVGRSEELKDNINDLFERTEQMRDRATAMLAWMSSLSKSESKQYDPYSHNFAEIADILPIKADEMAAQSYKRAPIRIGILLVLIGALFQIVGSWPCNW